jgi:multicomponent Na+:H+ antiporter subunit C
VNAPVLFGLCGAVLVGIGLYGMIALSSRVRRIVGFNVVGSGIFLVFGSLSARHPTLATDPVPQAMIITGIVVALAGTAFGLALAARLSTHLSANGGETDRDADAG